MTEASFSVGLLLTTALQVLSQVYVSRTKAILWLCAHAHPANILYFICQ